MKRIVLILLSIAIILTACGKKTDVVVDSAPISTKNTDAENKTADCKIDGHNWKEATCESPKTCMTCGETEGEPLAHQCTDDPYWYKHFGYQGAENVRYYDAGFDGNIICKRCGAIYVPERVIVIDLLDEGNPYLLEFEYDEYANCISGTGGYPYEVSYNPNYDLLYQGKFEEFWESVGKENQDWEYFRRFEYEYDDFHNLVKVYSDNGPFYEFNYKYDDYNNIVVKETYDHGELQGIMEYSYTQDGKIQRIKEYPYLKYTTDRYSEQIYDENGYLIEENSYDYRIDSFAIWNYKNTLKHDQDGRVIEAQGRSIWEYSYDDYVKKYEYTYDDNNNLTCVYVKSIYEQYELNDDEYYDYYTYSGEYSNSYIGAEYYYDDLGNIITSYNHDYEDSALSSVLIKYKKIESEEADSKEVEYSDVDEDDVEDSQSKYDITEVRIIDMEYDEEQYNDMGYYMYVECVFTYELTVDGEKIVGKYNGYICSNEDGGCYIVDIDHDGVNEVVIDDGNGGNGLPKLRETRIIKMTDGGPVILYDIDWFEDQNLPDDLCHTSIYMNDNEVYLWSISLMGDSEQMERTYRLSYYDNNIHYELVEEVRY